MGADGVAVDLFEADVWLATERFERARRLYAKAEPAVSDAEAASFNERFSRACLGLGDRDRYLRLLRKAAKLAPEAAGGEPCAL